MTLHLVKLCVGAESIEDLARWQAARLAAARAGSRPVRLVHTTFQTPRRQDALLDGGSIFWVIKGMIQVRQRLIGFDEGHKEDGKPCCLLVLDPELVPVMVKPRRPFQGWRYLDADDAPADLGIGGGIEAGDMPAKMRRELLELGLL